MKTSTNLRGSVKLEKSLVKWNIWGLFCGDHGGVCVKIVALQFNGMNFVSYESIFEVIIIIIKHF